MLPGVRSESILNACVKGRENVKNGTREKRSIYEGSGGRIKPDISLINISFLNCRVFLICTFPPIFLECTEKTNYDENVR